MAEFTNPHNIAYPVASDRIKDPNSTAKLADDIKAVAVSANDAITAEGARAEEAAFQRSKWKKNFIPANAGDIREYLYGEGKEGQYACLNGAIAASLTGLPDELASNPIGFTAVVETMTSGVVITLTPYDVWSVNRYVCTSAPSTGDGWTRWRKIKWDEDGEDDGTALSSARSSGFKTLPLILTAGHGGTSYAPATGNVEYDVNLAESIYVSRFRFAIRDGNPRWGVFTGQSIQLSNISVGGVSKLSSMTTRADGEITFSPWMKGNLGNLKFDYSAPIAPRLNVGGGRINGSRQTMMPFELWIEVETPVSTPAIGLIGDSNSVAVKTTIPVHDSWLQIYCRRMGFFPVLYGHSGWAMSASTDPDMYTWNRWNHLDTPDMVIHGNVANDLPSASEGGITLAELQERARKEIELADAKISKNHQFILLKSRASGINNTVRVQWNNWIKSLPDPIRDFQDIASPVTAGDTGGLLPQYISSDGIHMNTAGQTAIADSLTKVMTTRSSLVFDETAGRVVKAWDYLNQREQIIYGDTGERNITALSGNVASGNIYIQRTGNEVTLTVHQVKLSTLGAGSSTDLFPPGALPNGFRHRRTTWYPVKSTGAAATGEAWRQFGITSSGWLPIYSSASLDDEYRAVIKYTTNDPWPTSLPGVAA